MTFDEFDDAASRYHRTMQIDELRCDETDYDIPTEELSCRRSSLKAEKGARASESRPAIK